jgi:hypothetical protein
LWTPLALLDIFVVAVLGSFFSTLSLLIAVLMNTRSTQIRDSLVDIDDGRKEFSDGRRDP